MSDPKPPALTQGANANSIQRLVLPMPLGLAQRSAKCRICGESFFSNAMPKGWAYEFGEMLFPVHVILNFGDECAHAKCLERHNAGTQRPGSPDGSLATETRKPGSLK